MTNNIQKISSILLKIFNLLLITLPIAIIFLWLFIESDVIKKLLAQGLILQAIHTPEEFINLFTR